MKFLRSSKRTVTLILAALAAEMILLLPFPAFASGPVTIKSGDANGYWTMGNIYAQGYFWEAAQEWATGKVDICSSLTGSSWTCFTVLGNTTSVSGTSGANRVGLSWSANATSNIIVVTAPDSTTTGNINFYTATMTNTGALTNHHNFHIASGAFSNSANNIGGTAVAVDASGNIWFLLSYTPDDTNGIVKLFECAATCAGGSSNFILKSTLINTSANDFYVYDCIDIMSGGEMVIAVSGQGAGDPNHYIYTATSAGVTTLRVSLSGGLAPQFCNSAQNTNNIFGGTNIGTKVYWEETTTLYSYSFGASSKTTVASGLTPSGGIMSSKGGIGTDLYISVISGSNVVTYHSSNSGSSFDGGTTEWTDPVGPSRLVVTSFIDAVTGNFIYSWTATISSVVNWRTGFNSVKITMSFTCTLNESGAPTETLTLSGADVSPTTASCTSAGATTSLSVDPASSVTATVQAAGSNTRYLGAVDWVSSFTTTTFSTNLPTISVVNYYQTQNTYAASTNGAGPPQWDSGLSALVTGTVQGVGSTTGGTISPSGGSTTTASVSAWFDYNTAASIPTFLTGSPANVQWQISGTSSWTDTTGGNTHTGTYYRQVKNTFGCKPTGPTVWDGTYTCVATGTYLGVSSTTIATVNTVLGGGQVTAGAAFSDSGATVSLPVAMGLWGEVGGNTFTPTTGGSTLVVNYAIGGGPTLTLTTNNAFPTQGVSVTLTGLSSATVTSPYHLLIFDITNSTVSAVQDCGFSVTTCSYSIASHHAGTQKFQASISVTGTLSGSFVNSSVVPVQWVATFPTSTVAVTYSYVVSCGTPQVGGHPTIHITTNGTLTTYNLSTTPTVIYSDIGTSYTPLNPWFSNLQNFIPSPASGVITGVATVVIQYSSCVSSCSSTNPFTLLLAGCFFGMWYYTFELLLGNFGVGIMFSAIAVALYLNNENPMSALLVFLIMGGVFTAILPALFLPVGAIFLVIGVAGSMYQISRDH